MFSTVRSILTTLVCTVVFLTTAVTPVLAFSPKEHLDNLDLLVLTDPQLRLVETLTDAETVRGTLPIMAGIDRFRTNHGTAWHFTVDLRRGVPSLVGGGALPFLPGKTSNLSWDDVAPGCHALACVPSEHTETLARQFLQDNADIFGLQQNDLLLDSNGTGAFGASMYLLRFQWRREGIPIEGASVYFRINGGNLIQVATEKIGPIDLDTNPTLSVAAARETLELYLGSNASKADVFKDQGSLRIIPVTPRHQDAEVFEGEIGTGIAYRLAYRFTFHRPGVVGTWEGLVDAHTGEIVRFVDANRYGRVHGGAYPKDDHVGEADRPFPYADTGMPAPNQYADAGGLFPGDNATTTLKGRFTWITDYCGTINNTTTDGDVDFSLDNGANCDVPDPNNGGAGNTHSARTQYWHLTNVNIKARSYMPDNTWLNNDHMNVNTNQSPWCNATSGSGTLNFYLPEPGDCWNLGELPGVSLHEWGHSMDDFDGSGGDSEPVETRADWTATLQTHDSCIGRGFYLTGDCTGYGDACLDCNGIRDGNWTLHTAATPWTAANHGTFWSCSGGSYYGPCGWGDHCESGISTQALWDFVTSDLTGPPTGMDLPTAWGLADRLFYTSMATLGSMYTCTAPTSTGCNGSSLYNTMMAIDDDGDGTENGTPHAAAIFAALDRHNIACGEAGDAKNQNQTSCPPLTVGILTASAGSDAATLSWDAVANATRYHIFRNEIGCDAGFTRVATVDAPTTTYTDTTVVNGIEYYYRFQAVTASDSCISHLSACAVVTPQPCAGSVKLDRAVVNCGDVVSLSLVDSDLIGQGDYDVEVWSDSEPTPEILTLIETPPSSGIFLGAVVTTATTTPGDLAVGVVDGDTVTVLYRDKSYCGPLQDVETQAAVDCAVPLISTVESSNVTGYSADINWFTDEPADSVVIYENAVPPTANTYSDDAFVTFHDLTLTGLEECTQYNFEVASTDPAGNTATDDNGGQFFTFSTGKNTEPTYPANDTPVAIVDYTTVASVISVGDDKPILDVNVLIDITHSYDGDLEISLLGPNGVEVMLVDNRGSSGDNFTNTVFDDEAAIPITDGTAPYTGSFRPEEPLSTFDNLLATGDWTLKVNDTAGSDQGTINTWSITFLFPGEVCPSSQGWIALDRGTYGCTATMEIVVQDVDLLGDGALDVEVWSDTETTRETVSLIEDPANSGVFAGLYPTTGAGSVHGDGMLSLATGDTISAEYLDANDGQGGYGVANIDTAAADCDGPAISGVTINDVTGRGAIVEWATTEPADSRVTYDSATPPAAFFAYDDAMVTEHSIELEGLSECTPYSLFVESADIHSNTAMDDNAGLYYQFATSMSDLVDFASTDTPVAIPDDTPTGVTSTIPVVDDRPVIDVDVMINITHTYDGDLDITLIGPNGTRVELTSDNGSTGENFADTVFDDEATTPIADGTAPFTGSFQPEQPLSVLDGLNAAGGWGLEVIDDAGIDTGTLNSWSLILTYVAEDCSSLDAIFIDGFEEGGTSAWSLAID